jgi:hypothetical protein
VSVRGVARQSGEAFVKPSTWIHEAGLTERSAMNRAVDTAQDPQRRLVPRQQRPRRTQVSQAANIAFQAMCT